ncbi:4-(cytidine 5'-diphospho)-2-C-methyl-D-erythritol kinase [Tabrizicola sp.]|uniref:4-(cytidine 5'-diphospho)-2-C-methyl-D-erythritol kinase n=1 Tax=Tabrizicola sp. TaxID=2005166 RepID=UPI00273484B8|nr:4-(cytidine 5'-diphospho)-2-C-methyl-D-erythritol kinase [Tabrizicola sp.]MDP3193980.1 4-(cytidine 5'-diphospho)-2-C-methyl-D-erythritol kinase [Tabrizicola sp.]
MTTEAVAETAPAKVNLCLHVTGRRLDGYHLLDSLVVFADVADRVFASPAHGLSLVVAGPEGAGLQAEPDNLVLRAARLMGVEDAALVLDKRLPVASGIGGGSADAAAALRALARLTGLPLPSDFEVLQLGADVPVCLSGRPARMTGIGEQVHPLPALPHLACVLVNPRLPVPTPQVFATLTERQNPPLPDLPAAALATAEAFAGWLATHSRNDLVAPAREVAPILVDVQAALEATPGCLLARMSGSGGTHFALFSSSEAARTAAMTLRAAHPFWWIETGRILD